MEDENKNLEENNVVDTNENKEAEVVDENNEAHFANNNALTGFILTVIASSFAFAHLASIIGVILILVANPFNQKGQTSNHRVFKVFNKISRIAAPWILIVSGIMFVIYLIVTIVRAING